jgi:putative DNA primase/helicase
VNIIPENRSFDTHQESIPAELRALAQWVNWRYEDRDGRRTKAPIDAKSNGRLTYAKSNDRATWSDFNTALAACGRHPELAGVGFCFAPDDGLTGIDLDHVFNPDTGELTAEAAEILAKFQCTYAEISPSGTGLRLFCYGKPKRSGKNAGKVKWCEVYSHPSSRYLTVTGNHWTGNGARVTDQQAALDWLHATFMESTGQGDSKPSVDSKPGPADPPNLDDAALLDKARRARNGAEFERLWSGDTSGHGGDDSAADLALCNILAFWTGGDPDRIDRLFRQSGLMRPKWDTRRGESTYGAATIAKAIESTRETYSGRPPEPQRPEAGAANVEPTALDLDPYRGTDEANAALFLSLHGADVRYCPPWDKWLLWTGSHWRIDDLMDVARLAGDMPRELYRKAGEAIDTARRRTIAGLARALESRRRQSDLLAAARCRVVVSHTDLDKGRFLLNARNGTIDLLDGTLREHRRVDLLTHDTEIFYRPDTAAPLWERFLSEVFDGDADLIRFVQRAVGYSLTGDVREQVLLICHGSGSNGKSVFLNIVRKLLGKLALQAAPDLLMADRHRRHPTEQADLFGKRLVVCQETAEGRRFNEALVKQLTGGDAITARRMFEDNWTFEPTHKLWLATNHRPEIRGTDHAIWRRIRMIPFNVQFSDDGDHKKDPDMEAKLTAELPGIMAWGVRGCLDWQREGLRAPEAVKAATANYQQEQDVLAAWLADCCIVKRTADAKAAELYASYADWCDQSGEHPEPQRRWGMRLTERGFHRQRRMVGIFWLGIGLLKAPHEPYERNEPEKAKEIAPQNLAGKSAKSGSYGSLGTCSPPVDVDEPDALVLELAALAELDTGAMLAGNLTESDWAKLSSAAVIVGERHPEGKELLTSILSRIDAAYMERTP